MKPLSVSDISKYITQIFDSEELLHNVKVYGEISGFGIVRGNAYFSIKDENSLLSCVLFGAERFSNIKNGDQVVLDGSLKYYGKGGKVNFYTANILPYGLGLLYQQFLELKERLQKEGLFDESKKKPIPENIKTVGIITSSTGAVLHDIINVTSRRNPTLNLFLYPAKVQGVDAEKTIIDGLNYFEKTDVDIVIVARGGGSLEDLQPFNTEALARCVFSCKKPIISAVGHETDFTIMDFVSDLRAPTPSAAAEIVSKDIMKEYQSVKQNLYRIFNVVTAMCNNKKTEIDLLSTVICNKTQQNIDFCANLIKINAQKMKGLYQVPYQEGLNIVDKYVSVLNSLNPARLLQMGYGQALKDNVIVKSVNDVNINDRLEFVVQDGNISTQVISKKGEK